MDRDTRIQVTAITAISVVVIVLAAYIWPGQDGGGFPSRQSMLYDEALVEEIYQKVSPAVVEIYADQRSGSSYVQSSAGSGFLIDNLGHIATNNHVVGQADRVRVSLSNGTDTEATVLGRNPANDLVLIKVPQEKVAGIEPVKLGDSSRVRPGQLAIVIGSPFGLKGSVSVGVSSGIDRGLPSDLGRFIPGMIQTDALIGPGNSGGPMLNRKGEVVGITTAIELTSAQYTQHSVGFAVPINTLKEVLPALMESHEVRPPWLGTMSRTVQPLLAERLELPVDWGFYVIRVMPGSPAEQAGLVASGVDSEGRPAGGGDIIVAVDGQQVLAGTDLTAALNRHRPGDPIVLTVIRGGEKTSLPVTLGVWPEQ